MTIRKSTSPRLGIVAVSYGHEKIIRRLLLSIQPQMNEGDKLIIVDNKKPYELASYFKKNTVQVDIVEHDNGGFGAGCNYGASKILDEVDVLLFLNPDTYTEQDDYLENMRSGGDLYDAWQSLLLLPDGSINSAGNIYHISGLSWTDKYGETEYPKKPFNARVLSGACLAVQKKWWIKVGGFTEEYFMYGEDLDLSVKIFKAGGTLGVIPSARLYHDYDYEKGKWKWLYIERNRLNNILINWPLSLIVLTFIPNILFNIVIFMQYLLSGKGWLKIKADLLFLRMIPVSLRLRKRHQALNSISTRTFLKNFDYKVSNPQLGKISNNSFINTAFKGYFTLLKLFFV